MSCSFSCIGYSSLLHDTILMSSCCITRLEVYAMLTDAAACYSYTLASLMQCSCNAQEEEEWQEVLAQQDSFQRAAEPTPPVEVEQTPGNPANSPQAVPTPGAVDAAQAALPADAAGRESEGNSMQAGVFMPAATEQSEAMLLGSHYTHEWELQICRTRQQHTHFDDSLL